MITYSPMQWKNIALVLMGVIVGCAGGAASSAVAKHPPTVPRFQHMCLGPSMSIGGINEDVEEAGAAGWELVAMSDGIVCFKRPVF